MRSQEQTAYEYADYLHHDQPHINAMNSAMDLNDHRPNSINNECREQMIDWCYQIVEYCNLHRETVEIAMSYLDRFMLAIKSSEDDLRDMNRWMFQLSAMTALYLAVKVNERQSLDSETISKLSRGTYTKEQIEWMESKMLHTLKWRVNPPTALAFVHQFLELLPESDTGMINSAMKATIYDISKFQIELAMRNSRFLNKKKSELAFSVLLNSLESLCDDSNVCAHFVANYLSRILKIDWQTEEFSNFRNHLFHAIAMDQENDIHGSASTIQAENMESDNPTFLQDQQEKQQIGHRCSPRTLVES